MIVSALKEPLKENLVFRTIHNKRKQRHLCAMLYGLRDQLYRKQYQIPLPTNWLLDQLIDNALRHSHHDIANYGHAIDWHYLLQHTLLQMIEDTQSTHCLYQRQDAETPLFPNEELMDQAEVKEFAEGVLKLLKEEHRPYM